MVSDKQFIIILIIVGVGSLGIIIGVVGQGDVRLVGILGVDGKENPTLIMRTSFAYILTVINDGNTEHRLYIDGLEVQTDLLSPGEKETITIFPKEEGVYNYY